MSVTASILFEPIAKGFQRLKTAIKLSAVDIWGALVFAFVITFTFDKEKIKKLVYRRRQAIGYIANQQKALWNSIIEAHPGMSAVALISAPVPYISSYLLMNYHADMSSVQNFFRNAGTDSEWFENLFGVFAPPDPGALDRAEVEFLNPGSKGYQSAEIQRKLTSILNNLEKVFDVQIKNKFEGVENIRHRLSEEKEKTDKSGADRAKFAELISKNEKEINSMLKIRGEEIIEEKRKTLKEYVSALNSHNVFLKETGEASTVEEMSQALKKMSQNSPLELSDSLISDMKKSLKDSFTKISSDEKLAAETIKLANIEKSGAVVNEEEGQKIDRAELQAAVLKLQMVKFREEIKKGIGSEKFKKDLEEFRQDLIRDFSDGLDSKTIDEMSKFKDSEYVKLLLSGIEELKKAGLR